MYLTQYLSIIDVNSAVDGGPLFHASMTVDASDAVRVNTIRFVVDLLQSWLYNIYFI